MARLDYRPDIDGLRAYAVMAVLLFHAGVPGLKGGFVGVDIFFVISGFLITRLLVGEVADGTFSIGRFYERRARRLFPALFVTIVATFAVSAVLLAPQHFKRMAGSALAALLSLSNVFFWNERGYFDTASESKPLLHTWSLAVEEQFYLVWPAIIVVGAALARRTGRPWVLPACLAAVGLLSLWACQRVMLRDLDAAFFLTPFRGCEFAIGALMVFAGRLHRPQGIAADILAAIGFASMLAPVFLFGPGLPFPGLTALVPCIGTALLIHAGQAPRVGRLLDNPVAIGLGLISYSLYLVHWPIIVLYKAAIPREFGLRDQVIVLAASLVAALLLYRIVETPFRLKGGQTRRLSPAGFGLACALATLAAVPVAAQAWASDGWVWRYKPELRRIVGLREEDLIEYTWSRWSEVAKPAFDPRPERWLVIGDSQAADLVNLFMESSVDRDVSVRGFNIDYICAGIFVPPEKEAAFYGRENVLIAASPTQIEACKETRARLFALPLIQDATRIFIAPLWLPWTAPYLDATIAKLRSLSRAPITVVGRKSLSLGSIDIVLKERRIAGIEPRATAYLEPWVVALNRDLAATTKAAGADFLDLLDLNCPGLQACYVVTPDLRPFMHNTSHYSRWGARFIAPKLRDRLPLPPRG